MPYNYQTHQYEHSHDAVTIEGIEAVKALISGINNKPLRKKILIKVSNLIVKNSKARITNYVDLQGRAWAPRSAKAPSKLQKKKMEAGLKKKLKRLNVTDTEVIIGFKRMGKIVAIRQQEGFNIRFTYAGSQIGNTDTVKEMDATAGQAKKLKQLGYKIAGKSPTIAWIKKNMTVASAGKMIMILEHRTAKQSWTAVIPPRSFLGITAADRAQIQAIINTEIANALAGVN